MILAVFSMLQTQGMLEKWVFNFWVSLKTRYLLKIVIPVILGMHQR